MNHRIQALLAAACTLAAGASVCTAASAAPPSASRPRAAAALHPGTRVDLTASLRGEAFANASYTFFAAQADRQRLASVGRLYRSTAAVELGEHFREGAALAGLVGSNAANLRAAIKGETYESTVMYPGFARAARRAGDLKAAELFTEIARDEAAHCKRFKAALAVVLTGKGRIPAPPKLDPVAVPAGMPKVRAARTKADLDTAMHGEARANALYLQYAARALRSGNPALARLFSGSAAVELREHFAGEAVLAGLVRSTRVNLGRTVVNERYEADTMYPRFAKRARAAGDLAVARFFADTAKDEARHAAAFQKALKNLR
ncbi:rubrerythrin family protein [Streptacidiphilus sp. ASG 303]|uniref:ferritin family protein n=1 Tax=Streptacidiphilus sp. ASG 303 TaxID=2896847 RepID=UPI001E462D41|nr:ferritin family protein [Streptacidiphilus sp. ASG 303]MCD0485959.1 rubrerythrin family protein [Streptacidiphilus sp. ASG 303]